MPSLPWTLPSLPASSLAQVLPSCPLNPPRPSVWETAEPVEEFDLMIFETEGHLAQLFLWFRILAEGHPPRLIVQGDLWACSIIGESSSLTLHWQARRHGLVMSLWMNKPVSSSDRRPCGAGITGLSTPLCALSQLHAPQQHGTAHQAQRQCTDVFVSPQHNPHVRHPNSELSLGFS